MAIHLDLTSPPGSSSLPEGLGRAALRRLLLGLAPDEACHAVPVTSHPVVSYTAVSPLPSQSCRSGTAVCSLLRYLSGRPGRTLSAIVLCGARKFLSRAGTGTTAAIKRSQTPNHTRPESGVSAVSPRAYPTLRAPDAIIGNSWGHAHDSSCESPGNPRMVGYNDSYRRRCSRSARQTAGSTA